VVVSVHADSAEYFAGPAGAKRSERDSAGIQSGKESRTLQVRNNAMRTTEFYGLLSFARGEEQLKDLVSTTMKVDPA
jgi:hypothetical protein